MPISDFVCGDAGTLHANITNETTALVTNFEQENPMNSIRVYDDFTVTLVPDQTIDVRLILALTVTTNPAVSSPHNTSMGG
ncbi:MAG TPA: hypothetical protein VN850_07535 [Candidatus Acidoferrales bacterium]|nr:hypothetical protein [Candidatus Acidoferrales bacterium]